MADMRILVVEDSEEWRATLRLALLRIWPHAAIDEEDKLEDAVRKLERWDYHLAVLDLGLEEGAADDPYDPDERGLELLRKLRSSRRNGQCGVIVVTGLANLRNIRKAFREYGVDDFISKDKFSEPSFIGVARAAILEGLLRRAETKENSRYRLRIAFGRNSLVSSELIGPDRRTQYTVSQPKHLDIEDLARRADNLNLLILNGGADAWRPEARSIGRAIYQALAGEQRILGDLIAARALARRFSDLWLQFGGPPTALGIPYELLRDEDDYLGLAHILTRSIVHSGPSQSRKVDSFHTFIRSLLGNKEPLRVLVIGSNSDGRIPAAEEEARSVALMTEQDLQHMGITCEVTLLLGEDASYRRFTSAMREGRYHILHYAGHGHYDEHLAEGSGLVLRNDDGQRLVTADELFQLARDAHELRLAYLSCCLGARTAAHMGRGDFHGTLEALSRADVPTVLGYRWTVSDRPAMLLAMVFYQMLWRTFSPGEAMLQARLNTTLGDHGRDDETWASPVLLMQNA